MQGGRWPWMLSAGGALLFTFLLLLVWLLRLVCGLYRWHPAVREVLFLLVSVVMFCWGFRGFNPITWYRLDVACCSGVGTTPTWHVSSLKRAYMEESVDWYEGRFGLRLVADDEEFHQNYHPRVGHGPCRIAFSSYAGITKPVGDAFELDLPQDDARNVRLSLADDSEALGVIVIPGAVWYEANSSFVESDLEPREWAGKAGYSWNTASPGMTLELPMEGNRVCFILVYRPGVEEDWPADCSPYDVVPFGITRE